MEWIQDWRFLLAAVIALIFVLFIGGRYYWKLKKEITEFIEAINSAVEDDTVDDNEMAQIIKEGKDIGRTLKEITLAVLGLLSKR